MSCGATPQPTVQPFAPYQVGVQYQKRENQPRPLFIISFMRILHLPDDGQ